MSLPRWQLIVICGLFFFISCRKADVVYTGPDLYYPVKDYVINDYKLQRENKNLEKKVTINGKEDVLLAKDTTDSGEIEFFKQLDINHLKYKGAYQGDTTYGLGGEMEHILYRAILPDVKIKSLEIFFTQKKIRQINAVSENRSIINFGRQSLTYTPGSGYHLSSVQKLFNKDTLKMEIEARFVPR